ncbi:MAG TPA: BON domain-containing protein [Candidatus Binatia bacterium]|nr:BON domain-containing protein [Candidatus Binatia bacterium]
MRSAIVHAAAMALLVLTAGACDRRDEQVVRDEQAVRKDAYGDERVVAEVQHELKVNGKFESDAVAVRAMDGVVTLSGQVASHADRKRAEDLAKGVQGVQRVDNQIAVAGGGGRSS